VKVLVVDDEPLARRRLIRMLGRIADVEVVGEAGDVPAALDRIRAERRDLVLLDVEMPGRSGLELARSVEKDLPAIVFTTAYKEYALDAFEVSAVDYLVKPITSDRLAAALEKVRKRTVPADAARLASLLERLDRRAAAAMPARLHARFGGTTRLVDASEVTRICASAKYALFQHEGREFVLDESLSTLEARLRDAGFLRVHRADLVNLSRVRALHTEDGATTVELSDGQRAPVSRRMLTTLKQRLGIAGGRADAPPPVDAPTPGGEVERRLAAILSADAVGYSRLMPRTRWRRCARSPRVETRSPGSSARTAGASSTRLATTSSPSSRARPTRCAAQWRSSIGSAPSTSRCRPHGACASGSASTSAR
jgi:DNA-binding LytR/AlgR family response regulator